MRACMHTHTHARTHTHTHTHTHAHMHTHTLYLLLMLVDTYALLISTNYHNIYSVLKNKKKTYFFFSVCCFACSKNKVYISPVLEAFDSAASLCSF